MASMRICAACRRPNGPQFLRCMACGGWLGRASAEEGGPTDPRDAATRALRLLSGMTPQRRALLPAEFLRSVQLQSRGLPEAPVELDAELDPDDSLSDAPRWEPTASMRRRPSGPVLRGDEQDDTVTAGYDVREIFPDEDHSGAPAAWARSGWSPAPGVWAPDPGDSTIDEPLQELSSDSDPLVRALSEGRGPFGPRDAQWRLLLLPSPDYRHHEERFKTELRSALDIDLYTGLLFLHRPVPTYLASAERPDELHRAGQRLGSAGLRVLLIERGTWFERRLPESVFGAAGQAPGPVRLATGTGEQLSMAREEIVGAVLGELRGTTDVWALDLLRQRGPALRIRSDWFDFDCLGPMSDGHAARLLQRLVRWLSPDPRTPIPCDDHFKHVPATPGPGRPIRGDIGQEEADFTEYSLLIQHARYV